MQWWIWILVVVLFVILALLAVAFVREQLVQDVIPEPIEDIENAYQFKGLVREQVVCSALETIYKKGFATLRPDFLINPDTGHRLEYDCYNSELKIAAECNGEHHYVYPNKYHKTVEEFENQVKRDRHKLQLSDKNGVYLLTVPYWVPTDAIPAWIEYYKPESVSNRQYVESLIDTYQTN